MDRLVTKATPEGTLSYTYDAAGHVATITSSNPNGASASYRYDDLNRLSAVVDNRLPGNNTTTYTYDPANNLALATLPNGLRSSFSYDQLNRVTSLVTPISGYSYQYDATGKRTTAVEINGRTLNWNYDGINRLTRESVANDPTHVNGSAAYTLDPVGNRLAESSNLPNLDPGSFSYNADDQLMNESYDANGNVLSTGGNSFTYDSENHLIAMNGGAVGILYDAFGNRVAKTVNGVTTRYLVEDDLNPTGYPQVVDELTNGAVTRTYTYGLQRISQDQIIANTWTPSFYGYDGGGSVRQLTNAARTVTDTYEYDAWGNTLATTGSTPNEFLYRGEQYDSDLSLYYLRARYYNPVTGRFMSRDPESGKPHDPKTLQKYLFVDGDPVNLIDPTGRATYQKPGDPLGDYLALVSSAPFRVFVFTQYVLPSFIESVGPLRFWGTAGATVATVAGVAQWFCSLGEDLARATSQGTSSGVIGPCGIEEEDPGPGPFEPEEPRDIVPGQAGAQH